MAQAGASEGLHVMKVEAYGPQIRGGESSCTVRVSTEEINASPMSFDPFGPDWAGASNALITLGGEYNGANGTDTLTIEARRTGLRGTNNLRLWVNDSLGNRVTNLDIRSGDPPDQQYELGNGLFLTLGAGSTVSFDTASFSVSDTIGAVVKPDNPLGGYIEWWVELLGTVGPG